MIRGMEKTYEFLRSKDKSRADIGLTSTIIGLLIWIPSCIVSANSDIHYVCTILILIGLTMTWFGIRAYNENNIKWKLTITENGVSETGEPGHMENDWHISWNNIKEITYKEGRPSIVINLKNNDNSLLTNIVEIYGYNNLKHIYNLLKDHIERYSRQEQIYLETLTKEESIRQQKEKDYFQRIKKLEELQKIDPLQFEKIISTLFKRMGYDVLLTKASRDEGIDLIITKNGKKSVVQCKRYSGTVGQPTARDLYGSMIHNHAEDAYLITTGVFSLPAQTWASGKPIHLVDGNMLVEWIETILSKD